MKINKVYSDNKICTALTDIETFGQSIGGEHTIKGRCNSEDMTFVMLMSGGWRGGRYFYYKRIK